MKKYLVCAILAMITMFNPPLVFSIVLSLTITIVLLLTTAEQFMGEDNINSILEEIKPNEEANDRMTNLLIIMGLFFVFSSVLLFNIFSHLLIK